jgi:hypothetical protein
MPGVAHGVRAANRDGAGHDRGYTFRFAYNPTLVDLVKQIASRDRAYDPTSRQWTVYGDLAARRLAEDMVADGYDVHGPFGSSTAGARRAPPDHCDWGTSSSSVSVRCGSHPSIAH